MILKEGQVWKTASLAPQLPAQTPSQPRAARPGSSHLWSRNLPSYAPAEVELGHHSILYIRETGFVSVWSLAFMSHFRPGRTQVDILRDWILNQCVHNNRPEKVRIQYFFFPWWHTTTRVCSVLMLHVYTGPSWGSHRSHSNSRTQAGCRGRGKGEHGGAILGSDSLHPESSSHLLEAGRCGPTGLK